ncbi:MAG: hypothetical protein II304_10425 [Bacteroidales bacterium]|nr:hypothetical protein [Bacteroidales bacterium]
MINVNIKSGGEEHVTDSKQKFNLNDVLNGTVVLTFEEELSVIQKAVENIREIHEDCKYVSDENPILKGTLQFSSLIWHMLLNKVYNKAINLLKNEIDKTQDENKKIEYKNLLKDYNEYLERSEEVLDNLNKQHADVMWFGID